MGILFKKKKKKVCEVQIKVVSIEGLHKSTISVCFAQPN